MMSTEGVVAPLRHLQMDSAGPVGQSALRHGKCWRWHDQFAGVAQVHLDGASYVLIQVLSGNEK